MAEKKTFTNTGMLERVGYLYYVNIKKLADTAEIDYAVLCDSINKVIENSGVPEILSEHVFISNSEMKVSLDFIIETMNSMDETLFETVESVFGSFYTLVKSNYMTAKKARRKSKVLDEIKELEKKLKAKKNKAKDLGLME